VIFPHDQMKILPYNRVVRDLRGRTPEALLAALRERLDVEPAADGVAATPTGPKQFGVYVGGKWYVARVRDGSFDASDPVKSLDCSICQDQILSPIFQVRGPAARQARGLRGRDSRASPSSRSGWIWPVLVALHLYPTQIEQLFAVSDAGLLMPPKSTWFEPKLRSGLFIHTF
jgi:uncharacterized protein (DUF1015 family)